MVISSGAGHGQIADRIDRLQPRIAAASGLSTLALSPAPVLISLTLFDHGSCRLELRSGLVHGGRGSWFVRLRRGPCMSMFSARFSVRGHSGPVTIRPRTRVQARFSLFEQAGNQPL